MFLHSIAHDANSNGQSVILMKASSDRVKGDPVYVGMSSTGLVDVTITSDASVHLLAVALENVASGSFGRFCVAGECDLTIASASPTAGHGIEVDAAAVESTGGAFAAGGIAGEAATDFGVIMVGGTSVTSIKVCLVGLPRTSSN